MQEDIVVGTNTISGKLKKLTSGSLPSYWGEGYFLALKFDDVDLTNTTVMVGLNPSVSSGLVALDSDKNGAFKITDKDNQVFVIEYTKGGIVQHRAYDLSGLVLAAEG